MRCNKSLLFFSLFLSALAVLLPQVGKAAIGNPSGSCTAFSAGCTLSAVATNDLKVVMASNTSSTIPSLPSGGTDTWASIATVTIGTLAIRWGCTKVSGTGDTGTDTWTNASEVDAVSVPGTSVNASGDCPTTGIGAMQTASGTSTTMSCSALTLKNTDNTSWAFCGFGDATNSGVTPGGMTTVVGSGTNWIIADSSGNAPVSSWAAHTSTISSQAWATLSFEILQHAPVTGVQPGAFMMGP